MVIAWPLLADTMLLPFLSFPVLGSNLVLRDKLKPMPGESQGNKALFVSPTKKMLSEVRVSQSHSSESGLYVLKVWPVMRRLSAAAWNHKQRVVTLGSFVPECGQAYGNAPRWSIVQTPLPAVR